MDEYRFEQDERSDFPLFKLRDPHPGWVNAGLWAVHKWCEVRFGPPTPRAPTGRWYMDDRKADVMFRDAQDAVEFKLRWC